MVRHFFEAAPCNGHAGPRHMCRLKEGGDGHDGPSSPLGTTRGASAMDTQVQSTDTWFVRRHMCNRHAGPRHMYRLKEGGDGHDGPSSPLNNQRCQ